ncbi:MAG: biotin--[acetyl-CoA-carboxylase] ligase [Defluviitaleaceae bacterium]|nr:biotin--[acetyl-CoA-carboxylase] ligase [Defluviitaleaceae bacterium]
MMTPKKIKRLIVLEQAQSTNTVLKEMCRRGYAGFNTIVYTENQISGYGRRGKFWHSEAGKNISVSLSLQGFDGDELLSLAAGVFAVEAVKAVCGEGLPLSIKWPNDVLLGGKKLCGISCEKIGGDFIVLGIGVNVNNEGFPKGLEDTATSLYLQTGKNWDLVALRDEIVARVFAGFSIDILDKVRQYCVNIGQNVRIIGEKGVIAEGKAVDIAVDGGIVVLLSDGTKKNYYSGEISLR